MSRINEHDSWVWQVQWIGFFLLVLAVLAAPAGADLTVYDGDRWVLDGPNTSDIIWGQNFTFDNATVHEYADGIAINGNNISIVANTSTRFNTTIWEYNQSGPVHNQTVLNVETNATAGMNVSYRFTVPIIAAGQYHLARDGSPLKTVGNIETLAWHETSWSSHNYTLTYNGSGDDTVAPTLSLDFPANNSYVQNISFINVSVNENITFMNVSINGGPEQVMKNTSNLDWYRQVNLSEGKHNASYRANDTADNEGTAFHAFTIDVTPPIITVHAPRNITINNSTVFLNTTASESIDTWQYSLNDGSNTSFSPNTTVSVNRDDQHNITVWAKDRAGNWNRSIRHFTTDGFPPNTTSNWTTSGWVSQDTAFINITSEDVPDEVSNLSYRVDSGSWTTVSGFWANLTITSQGSHTLEYNATGNFGDVESTNTEHVKLDNQTPSLTPDQPSNEAFVSGLFNITVTWSDSPSGVNISMYNVTNASGVQLTGDLDDTDVNSSVLADGLYNISYNATDYAGNTASNVSFISVTVDNTPPTTTDNWTVSGWQDNASVLLNLTGSDATTGVDRISYRVDNGTWTTVSGAWANVSISGDGNHTLEYNATDRAGNTEAMNTEYVALDTTAPVVTVHSPLNTSIADTTLWLNVTADETVDMWRYELNGTNVTFTPNATLESLDEGQHNVTVWANSSLGHMRKMVRFFTVDVTTPIIQIHSPQNTTYETSDVGLEVTASEAIATWQVNLDSGGNTTFTPNTTLFSLSDGQHQIVVWGNDSAGNMNGSTRYFSVATSDSGTADDDSDGSGGSGGGTVSSGSVQQLPGINLSTNYITVNGRPGTVNSLSFTLMNNGSASGAYNLTVEPIPPVVTLNPDQLELTAGETTQIPGTVRIPSETPSGIYQGGITVTTAGRERLISLHITVEKPDRLPFNFRVNTTSPVFDERENVSYEVEFYDIESEQPLTVNVSIRVFDQTGARVIQDQYTMRNISSITRQLEEELPAGEYTFEATATYNDKQTATTIPFTIKPSREQPPEQHEEQQTKRNWILVAVLLILMLSAVLGYRYRDTIKTGTHRARTAPTQYANPVDCIRRKRWERKLKQTAKQVDHWLETTHNLDRELSVARKLALAERAWDNQEYDTVKNDLDEINRLLETDQTGHRDSTE